MNNKKEKNYVLLNAMKILSLKFNKATWKQRGGGCSRGVMVKAMDNGIVAREFVLQSRYYVHFRATTLGKGMNPRIPPARG